MSSIPLHNLYPLAQVGVDAGPSWDWTCKFWELAYDGAVKDIKHHDEVRSDGSSL